MFSFVVDAVAAGDRPTTARDARNASINISINTELYRASVTANCNVHFSRFSVFLFLHFIVLRLSSLFAAVMANKDLCYKCALIYISVNKSVLSVLT